MILFDAGGKQGIAQASKTGWLYMLDRATGKPLYGIPEKAVPQNAEQQTWATQPIPDNGEFTPHGPVPAKDIARVKKPGSRRARRTRRSSSRRCRSRRLRPASS